MITVNEAEQRINESYIKLESDTVDVEDSTGYILNEDVVADRHFPPYDRVTMDGIALNFDAIESGGSEFLVQEMLPAGSPAISLANRSDCIEVMTGAVLPEGCDTVIKYEDIEISGEGPSRSAKLVVEDITRGLNVHGRGTDRQIGDLIVQKGLLIGPAEIGILATVGKARVNVLKWPEPAIISSGDELVSVAETPEAHQIRQSNSYSVQAAMNQLGIKSTRYHFSDQRDQIVDGIKEIFTKHKLIILSGGVSKGKKDYIPEALEICGVEKVFHRVQQRPGKPFWFGRTEEGHFVFALPGNPVSTFMNFYRFIKPWLLRSAGMETRSYSAILQKDFEFSPDLTYFLQARIEIKNGQLHAIPEVGHGSGDLANLVDADGFLELPLGTSKYSAGEVFNYYPYRG